MGNTQTRVGIRIGPLMISRNLGSGFVTVAVLATIAIWAAINWKGLLTVGGVVLGGVAALYVLIRLMVTRGRWRYADGTDSRR